MKLFAKEGIKTKIDASEIVGPVTDQPTDRPPAFPRPTGIWFVARLDFCVKPYPLSGPRIHAPRVCACTTQARTRTHRSRPPTRPTLSSSPPCRSLVWCKSPLLFYACDRTHSRLYAAVFPTFFLLLSCIWCKLVGVRGGPGENRTLKDLTPKSTTSPNAFSHWSFFFLYILLYIMSYDNDERSSSDVKRC